MSTNEEQTTAEPTVRDRAMDAAATCFQQQGLSKTSMESVAKQSKMSRATLYRHFANRDELAISVIEREAVRIALGVYQRIQKHDDFGDFIIEGMVDACQEIRANPILGSLFSPDSIATSTQLLLMTDRLTNIGLDVMKPMIEPAQKAGILRDDVSPEIIMDWVFRLLISLLTIPSETIANEKAQRQLLKLMLLPALLNIKK